MRAPDATIQRQAELHLDPMERLWFAMIKSVGTLYGGEEYIEVERKGGKEWVLRETTGSYVTGVRYIRQNSAAMRKGGPLSALRVLVDKAAERLGIMEKERQFWETRGGAYDRICAHLAIERDAREHWRTRSLKHINACRSEWMALYLEVRRKQETLIGQENHAASSVRAKHAVLSM